MLDKCIDGGERLYGAWDGGKGETVDYIPVCAARGIPSQVPTDEKGVW